MMKNIIAIMSVAITFMAFAQVKEGGKVGPLRSHGPHAMDRMERGMMGPGMGMHGDPAISAVMNPKVAEKLGLSEEVRQQIRKLDADARKAMMEKQQQLRAAMPKQSALYKAEKPDENAIMAAIDEVFELRKAIAKIQAKRVISIKAILTPEQLTKALAEMKSLRESRRANHAVRPPMPPKEGPAPEAPEKAPPAKDAPAKDASAK